MITEAKITIINPSVSFPPIFKCEKIFIIFIFSPCVLNYQVTPGSDPYYGYIDTNFMNMSNYFFIESSLQKNRCILAHAKEACLIFKA